MKMILTSLIMVMMSVMAMTSCNGYNYDSIGSLPGVFSVSDTKKVCFGTGNLQYKPSTKTWRFAENQYDVIGEDNAKMFTDSDVWIDLFGWGTGNDPAKSSLKPKDYVDFTDWGSSIEDGVWFTLSYDEWRYLTFLRDKALEKYGFAIVMGTFGTIYLPDEWNPPVEIKSLFHNAMIQEGNPTIDEYSLDEWKAMENSGALFLPAAGHRSGYGVLDVGIQGDYWTSTRDGNSAKEFLFDKVLGVNVSGGVHGLHEADVPIGGKSVRLARLW